MTRFRQVARRVQLLQALYEPAPLLQGSTEATEASRVYTAPPLLNEDSMKGVAGCSRSQAVSRAGLGKSLRNFSKSIPSLAAAGIPKPIPHTQPLEYLRSLALSVQVSANASLFSAVHRHAIQQCQCEQMHRSGSRVRLSNSWLQIKPAACLSPHTQSQKATPRDISLQILRPRTQLAVSLGEWRDRV